MPDITNIIRLLDREIWLVTATHDSRRAGMIATFVSHASIVPESPRMLIGIAKQHHTWSVIEASRAFTLHLLDEKQIELVWLFGLQTGHAVDKFAGLAPIDAGVAVLDCRVETALDTGDRTVYLAEVVDARACKSTTPLTMKRVLQLAPPERLRELRERLERDAAVDGEAIRKWREA